MRPGRFHPGNKRKVRMRVGDLTRFNEAGAFPPRKCGTLLLIAETAGFNEAGAFPPRK